jgi:hypothetical protein
MVTPEPKEALGKKQQKWMEIAEVRMLMYVIPVGITLALIGLVLSQLSSH